MIPTYLYLEGFRGIRAGQGQSKFVLDLADLSGELVAIIGRNGSGKTTVLDNLHPYRIMPSRVADGAYSPGAFSYWDHIEGHALKILHWSHDGVDYISNLVWDEKNGKRSQTATLKSADNFPVGSSDGKVTTYDAEVERILGPPSLYFTSAFAAQGRRQLAAYSASEMKSILSSMLGLSDIEALGQRAGGIRKRIGQVLAVRSEGLSGLAQAQADAEALTQELASLTERTEAATKDLEQLHEGLHEVREKLANLPGQAVLDGFTKRETELRERIGKVRAEHIRREKEINTRIETAQRRIDTARRILERRDRIAEAQAQVEVLHRALADYEGLDAHMEHVRQSLDESRKARDAVDLRSVGEQRSRLEAHIASAEKGASLIEEVPCRSMDELQGTCPLLREARTARDELPVLTTALDKAVARQIDREAEVSSLSNGITLLESQLHVLRGQSNECQSLQHKLTDARVLASQESLIEGAERDLADAYEGVQVAEEELLTLRDSAETEILALTTELSDVIGEIDGHKVVEEERRSLEKEVLYGEQKYDLQSFDLNAITREHARTEERLAQTRERIERITETERSLEPMQDWQAQFALLERALGRDGIIALIIDDAGPQIAAIANTLLEECYGGRYAIQIRTQRELRSGDLREGFEVRVLDGDTGELAEVGMKSGGQRVVIDEALTRAIAIYRMQSSGHRFDAIFADESDGALDAEAKVLFTRMKRSALAKCGARRFFFITHTQDAWEMADDVIRL